MELHSVSRSRPLRIAQMQAAAAAGRLAAASRQSVRHGALRGAHRRDLAAERLDRWQWSCASALELTRAEMGRNVVIRAPIVQHVRHTSLRVAVHR